MKKGFVFYGLLDFYKNKEVVVEIYNKMNIDEKEIYKMYVYSLPFMEDDIKDLIWDYINGFEEKNIKYIARKTIKIIFQNFSKL